MDAGSAGAVGADRGADGRSWGHGERGLAGREIRRPPLALAVNPADGSCWVGDAGNGHMVHLAANGKQLGSFSGFSFPQSASVNPGDGSCWVADIRDEEVVHLSAAGTVLWRGTGYWAVSAVSVNPTDGSCWFGTQGNTLIHLSADGAELWRSEALVGLALSVNAADNSCWAGQGWMAHVAADGALLWSGGVGINANSVSVNPTDGSCWVGSDDPMGIQPQAVHVSVSAQELWRSEASGGGPCFVSVDPYDGSCWIASYRTNWVSHVSAEGAMLWHSDGYSLPARLAVNPTDGSCWVVDEGHNQVVHLVLVGDIFPDITSHNWAHNQIEACFQAGIVTGYPDGSYGPTNPVTRDQMAVYISRALAGGDANVPAYTDTPSFSDVPTGYWALKYVEYAKEHGIVGGYGGGLYQPTLPVDRGGMAVFIARAMAGGDAGVPDPAAGTQSFPDVDSSFWSYKYVEYIKGAAVAGGYPDGEYHPEYVVTRDQMAVYVARAFGLN